MMPTDTDTGIGIVTKTNVAPYLIPNRFEGTSRGDRRCSRRLRRSRSSSRERAIGRSNVSCCPGGQPPPGQQREAGPSLGASDPARIFLYQRELTPIVITIVLFVFFAIDSGSIVHQHAQPQLGRPATPGRSARSPWQRCSCWCSPRSTYPPVRSSCSRRGSMYWLHGAGLPLVPAILLALARCCLGRSNQRADHRVPERAVLRHDAGDELHPLRRWCSSARTMPRPVPIPLSGQSSFASSVMGNSRLGRDHLGGRDRVSPQLDAHADTLRRSHHRNGRQPCRAPPRRACRSGASRSGRSCSCSSVAGLVGIVDAVKYGTLDPGQTSASTTSSTPSAPA